ncbi:MAG: sulfotransferase [Bacteroidota bacterium]
MPALAFLLYDNRSGSTLLSALLSEHAGVAVSHETDLVAAVLEAPGPREVQGAALADYLYASTRFGELGLDRGAVAQALGAHGATLTRQAALRTLVRHYFEAQAPAAEAWVVKGPRLHYHLRALAAAFPEAALLHLVRDGRAVFRSKRATPSGHALRTGAREVMDDDLVRAAHNWQRKIALVDAFDGLAVHAVRYEDLLCAPEAELGRLLDAAGVSDAGRTRSATRAEFVQAQVGGTYHGIHASVAGDLDPAKAARWRTDLAPDEIALYEALAGDALARYGYERTATVPGSWAGRVRQRVRLLGLRVRRERSRWAAAAKAVRRGEAGRVLRGKAFEWKARRVGPEAS